MAVKGSNWSSYGVPVLLIIAFGLLLLLQQTDLFRPSGPLKSGLEGVLVEQMALEPFLMPPDDQSGPKTDADLQGKIRLS